MIETKRDMRTRIRAERDGFVSADPSPVSAPHWLIDPIRRGQIVAAYIPHGSEADPALLIRAAHDSGARIVLPHVTSAASPIRFLAWKMGEALEPGPFGLSQPATSNEELSPDIILTPLVAFDAALHRLGQGAGHYDRAFARFPDALRVGIAWSVQQVAAIDTDPWDVPLHAAITERDSFRHLEPA